jgi:molecular chaperone Hsp33
MTRMTDPSRHASDAHWRFLLARSGVRGAWVGLDSAWREIRGRAEYPAAVAGLLGQTSAAAALFAGQTKIDGRLSLQLQGNGRLRSLFAECTAAGTLRGLARFDPPVAASLGPRDFGDGSLLAITIESALRPGGEPQRYQGLVDLDADTLEQAFEGYFGRSEQLPTRLLLAADERQARGLLLQKLPADHGDPDGWPRAQALFDTLGREELLATPPDVLLYRLFHDEEPGMLGQRALRFACSCSRERVEDVLRRLGQDEALAAASDGQAEVGCEFCGTRYLFSPDQIRDLFALPPGVDPGSSPRVH